MKNLFKKLLKAGIRSDMPIVEKKDIFLLNKVSILIVVFFSIISVVTYEKLHSPIISSLFVFNAVTVFLITLFAKFLGADFRKFIISMFIPVAIVLIGAYSKSIGVTNNLILYLSPRMLLTITILIPVLFFGYKKLKQTIIAITPGIVVFIFYDKIHSLFGIYIEDMLFKPEFYALFVMVIVFFMVFIIMIILSLQSNNLRSESKLRSNNEDLAETTEELRQQNEEMSAINYSLKVQQEMLVEQKEEKKKLLTAVEQSDSTIMITNIEGTIEYVNPKFVQLTGYFKEEVVGRSPKILSSGYHSKTFYKNLWATINAGKVWTGAFKNRKKNGELYWEQAIITPVKNSHSEITNFVAVKEDITQRREEDEKLKRAYGIIEEKNNKLTHGINYAKYIQKAILGAGESIKHYFPESVIYYKPLDIVSGDFYWFGEIDNKKIIIAADCTGHGVAGAFLTILGCVLLDEIITLEKETDPAKILYKLDERIIQSLQGKKNADDNKVHSGMDMAVLVIDEVTKKIDFAGAKNPFYHVCNNEINETKGSIYPIGSTQYHKKKVFETVSSTFQKGDTVYLASDGFQDQFGGSRNIKYMKKRFREFLLKVSHLPMAEQRESIKKELLDWKANNPQTDDVLVIGIKL